jgi:hypothetical protein
VGNATKTDAAKPTRFVIPWRGDLAGDVIVLQVELERLWEALSDVLARVDEAARTFAHAARGIDDKDQWIALGRRSGLACLDATLEDFGDRIDRARDELATVLEFEADR